MAAAMVVLRLTTATPQLPEILGEAIVGVMPAPVFSFLLDNLRTAAKPTLYVIIGIGMLVVGGLLGKGFAYGEPTWTRALKLAAVVWAVIGLLVLPLLGAGLFGTGVRAGLPRLSIQLALVVGSYAGALLLLLRATEPHVPAPALARRRRLALGGLVGGLAALVAGGAAWWAIRGTGSGSGIPGNADPDREPQAVDAAPSPTVSNPAADADADAVVAPSPVAAARGPVRGVPSIDAPAVPMTVQASQAAPPPFDVPKLSYEVLASDDFYTVSKNLIDPGVDMASWSLKIDGLVERPGTFTYADLTSLPSYSDYYTLQCISNGVGGDLWGNAHWKGVRLVELLSRVGLKPGIRKVVFHADDGYTDSIVLDAALRPDTLLAYEMNGAPLAKEHGYPARLLVPGIYGMKNVKWITRIELVDHDFKGYWMLRGWSDAAPYNTATRIDVPANRAQVDPGEVALGGVTFAGFRGIQRVEVSLDDGRSWEEALLKPALSQNAWSLWAFKKTLTPGTYSVKVRAVDGNGDVQTDREQDSLPDGATGYHAILLRVG
jgi:DMSO/TMAO reductase YedYZ molybdopterin-dependent catalytic subunit